MVMRIFLCLVSLGFGLNLAQAQEQSQLKVCTFAHHPPYTMEQDKIAQGIDVDLMVALLRDMEQPAVVNMVSRADMPKAVQEGACDVVYPLNSSTLEEEITGMTYLRALPFRYQTYSLFRMGQQKPTSIDHVRDLFGLRLGMTADFKITVGVQQAVSDRQFRITLYRDRAAALAALKAGRLDGVLDQSIPMRYAAYQAGIMGSIIQNPIAFIPQTPVFLGFPQSSLREGQDGLRRQFHEALKRLHLQGDLLRYTAAYFES